MFRKGIQTEDHQSTMQPLAIYKYRSSMHGWMRNHEHFITHVLLELEVLPTSRPKRTFLIWGDRGAYSNLFVAYFDSHLF